MVLSEYLEQKRLADMKTSGKFTLLADESTDVSTRTQLSIFARWITTFGAREHFMGLENVYKTTNLALMEAMSTFCHDKTIEMKNVRFMGLDGCNTMS